MFAINFVLPAGQTEPRLIIRTCKHILDRGVFCRAPAMNKRDYCHAHLRLRQCRWRMARAGRRLACLKLPPPVDMQAVRTTTVRVRAALAGGHIDPSWARLMLWAMQLATANLRYMERRPRFAEAISLSAGREGWAPAAATGRKKAVGADS